MTGRSFLILITVAALTGACSSNEHSRTAVAALTMESPSYEAAPGVSGDSREEEKNTVPAPVEQKIIKEGNLRFSVNDFAGSRAKLAKTVAEYKGYIIAEKEQRSDMSWRNEMVVKVPAANFDACLNALCGNAKTLDEKNISAQDVTEQYIDIAARLKAKKEVEQRYLQILQQARSVKDILEVEGQLKNIREEIESAQGRLQYIDHRAAMSTINLVFYQTFSTTSPQSPGFFSRAWFAVKDGWNGLLAMSVVFLEGWPLWLILAIAVIAWKKFRKRRQLAKKLAAQQ